MNIIKRFIDSLPIIAPGQSILGRMTAERRDYLTVLRYDPGEDLIDELIKYEFKIKDMTCKKCEKRKRNKKPDRTYHWRNIRIRIGGCNVHMLQIVSVLNRAKEARESEQYWIEYGDCDICGEEQTRGIEMESRENARSEQAEDADAEMMICESCLKKMLEKL